MFKYKFRTQKCAEINKAKEDNSTTVTSTTCLFNWLTFSKINLG